MVRNATAPVFADPALAGNGEHHHTRGLGIAYYERYALKLLRGDFRNAGAHDALADAEFMDLEIGCRAEVDVPPATQPALPGRLFATTYYH